MTDEQLQRAMKEVSEELNKLSQSEEELKILYNNVNICVF